MPIILANPSLGKAVFQEAPKEPLICAVYFYKQGAPMELFTCLVFLTPEESRVYSRNQSCWLAP